MIRCPRCRNLYSSAGAACPVCEFLPVRIDQFTAWAPEHAYAGVGYKIDHFYHLVKIEDGNFWFRGRNALILWSLSKYFPRFKSFMEVGCGTGYVLSAIAALFPGRRLVGSEPFVEGLHFARQRVPEAQCLQMDADSIPFEDEFDVIGAFDVLEHTENDAQILQNFQNALRPRGGLIISVPQHKWLWSSTDVQACHRRRYTASDIHHKLQNAGFNIIRSTSFVSILLPVMFISRRLAGRLKPADPFKEFNVNATINKIMEFVLKIERYGIRRGFNFPWGGSRLIVASKVRGEY